MEIRNFLLEDIIMSQGGPVKRNYTNIVDFDEEVILKELKSLNLNEISSRNTFYWELQKVIENHIYRNTGLNDVERLSEIIVESWNLENEFKVTKPTIIFALNQMNLTFSNLQRAFNSVCDGDFKSYGIFAKKVPNMFADLLFRLAICIPETNPIDVVDDLIPLLFEEKQEKVGIATAKRLKFYVQKRFLKNKAIEYRKYHSIDDFVFAEGMLSILNDFIKDNITNNSLKSFQKKLNEFFKHGNKVNENIILKLSEQSGYIDEGRSKDIAGPHQKVGNSSDTVFVEVISDQQKKLEQPNFIEDVHSSLESAICSLQEILSKIDKENEEITSRNRELNSSLEERLSIAEEEIKRLNLELKSEKEKTRLAEEKAYVNVLQAIGGEASNYLLSDLFEESQGNTPINSNISIGRLINLFSGLSLAIGLEEHGRGYELGSTFSLHKDTLIKEFRIDGPLNTQEEMINVKLIKFGWTLNGKVIVQPLVSETKEELLHD